MHALTGNSRRLALALLVIALILRMWGVGDFSSFQGDDREFVPKAKLYMEQGQFTNALWYHPPLGSILLYASIAVFGDNVYGWRMTNLLLGALSVLLVFLIGGELFKGLDAALLAALLLLFDPLHILLSRTTFEEVQAVAFFLAAVYTVLRYLRGALVWAPIAGVFLGMSIATKWYYAPAALILVVASLAGKGKAQGRSLSTASFTIASLVLIPLCVYLLVFLPWFGRGYDLSDLLTIHVNALGKSQALYLDRFSSLLAADFVPPSSWFVRPILFGFRIPAEGSMTQYVVFMNNMPWLLLTLPALLVLAWGLYRNRGPLPIALLLAVFVSTYVQFLIVQRPIFLYSSLALVPFAALAIAGVYVQMTAGIGRRNLTVGWAAGAVTIVGLYLYPLITMKHVPEAMYHPLLSLGRMY